MRPIRLIPHRMFRAALLAAVLLLAVAATAGARIDADWRIHIRDAAVVAGETVLLGEIADPVGNIPPQNWAHFAKMPLWQAPPRPGQPMTISRARLRRELAKYLGEAADLAVYPSSIAIQSGGAVVRKQELHAMVVSSLTRFTAQMKGEANLRDMQIPDFIFLRDRFNKLEVEPPTSLSPGQFTIRLREVTAKGELVRRITGGATLDQWIAVPCAAVPVNRHDAIGPDSVTFVKKNLAYLNGEVWNGKGGPWRVLRPIGTGGVIYQSDLELQPMLAKGARVDLVFIGKTLRLTVPVEVMADGKPGETIPVRNLHSKREVYATVQDENTVVIHN